MDVPVRSANSSVRSRAQKHNWNEAKNAKLRNVSPDLQPVREGSGDSRVH